MSSENLTVILALFLPILMLLIVGFVTMALVLMFLILIALFLPWLFVGVPVLILLYYLGYYTTGWIKAIRSKHGAKDYRRQR